MSVQPAEQPAPLTDLADTPPAVDQPAPTRPAADFALLSPSALAEATSADFYRAMATINETAQAAERAHLLAQQNLAVMVTEQITRHIITAHPDAALLFVRAVADFHRDPDGDPDPHCTGHDHRLAPYEITDDSGVLVSEFDALSPVHFLMERLSPLLGVQDQVLDLTTRQWAYDCSDI